MGAMQLGIEAWNMGTWESVFWRKWELIRAGGSRFGGSCEIWRRSGMCGLCDSELVIVAAFTDAPAARGELPWFRAVPSASLMLLVMRGIVLPQS
jgi:hypothetical protein